MLGRETKVDFISGTLNEIDDRVNGALNRRLANHEIVDIKMTREGSYIIVMIVYKEV